jgi:hypothetical protein
MSNDGTIDITDAADKLESSFELGANNLLEYELLLVSPIFAFPPIKFLTDKIIEWCVGKIGKWVEMQAFFMNTAARKASQASDYISAVNYKLNLPPNATEEEFKKAEQNEMVAFSNFVKFTN